MLAIQAQQKQSHTSSTSGKAGIQQKSKPFFIQAKPKIGPANDSYEQEADRVADAVVSGEKSVIQTKGISQLQRKCSACESEEAQAKFLSGVEQVQKQQEEEEEAQPKRLSGFGEIQKQPEEEEEPIQMKTDAQGGNYASSAFYSQLDASKSSGSPLNRKVQTEMSNGIGADFSSVRIHTDSNAIQMNKELGARAFTLGNHVYFNEGQFNANSSEGKRLIAHELTHVVQQGASKSVDNKQSNILQRNLDLLQLSTDQDFLNTSSLQLMQCVPFFNNLYRASSNYSIGARQIGDAVRGKHLREAGKYNLAYNSYARHIRLAREEAQNQNLWIGVISGVGVGIGVGLLAAFALPSTAAGAFALTLNEALIAGASAAGQAGMGAIITSGVTNAFTVPGGNLEPSGLSPDIVRSNVWEKAARIYREGLTLVESQQRLQQLSVESSELRRQIQLMLAGQTVSISIATLRQRVPQIYRTRSRLFGKREIIQSRLNQQQQIISQINQTRQVANLEYERGIWIMWLASLQDSESDMIDLDAIENRLLSIGLVGDYQHSSSALGVNFGRWTSKEDERATIRAATLQRRRIQLLLNRLQTTQISTLTAPNPFSTSAH